VHGQRTAFAAAARPEVGMRRLARHLTAVGLVALACQSEPPPLGSTGNPVRADGFTGELEYLGRLLCADGSTPQAQGLLRRRARSGRLIEGFRVRCIYLNQERFVFFDGSHPGYAETRPVPGFGVFDAGMARAFQAGP
jgi:hypothetical protein